MRYDPKNPDWPERDRFIMSKGHCVPAQYVALAMLGVIPMEELPTLKQLGSRLQGHPAMQYVPGIEGCTGSLGQGLSYANGMALAGRIKGLDYRVYCLIGDGEMQEGQVWEAAMTSAKHCLGSVTAVIDANGLKAMDETHCGKIMEPIAARWAAMGWRTREIDGHDMAQICEALDWAKESTDTPSVIVAHTVKGKGISFIENNPAFHNAALTPERRRMTFTIRGPILPAVTIVCARTSPAAWLKTRISLISPTGLRSRFESPRRVGSTPEPSNFCPTARNSI